MKTLLSFSQHLTIIVFSPARVDVEDGRAATTVALRHRHCLLWQKCTWTADDLVVAGSRGRHFLPTTWQTSGVRVSLLLFQFGFSRQLLSRLLPRAWMAGTPSISVWRFYSKLWCRFCFADLEGDLHDNAKVAQVCMAATAGRQITRSLAAFGIEQTTSSSELPI